MLDLVVRVPRLPLPGETLIARGLEMFVGGKGANQAIAAKRLGAERVTLLGRVGADAFGERVIAALAEDGIDVTHVARDPSVATGTAIPMVLDDGGNSIISVPLANMAMTVAQVEAAADTIRHSDALLLQFEVPMECNIAAARIAREASTPVFLNTAPVAWLPDDLLALTTVLIANEVEAAALAPGSPRTEQQQALAFAAAGVPVTVVTLGRRGALLATSAGLTRIPPFPVEAVDTVGAGDAFCGALALAMAEGKSREEAARFASAAGAVTATRPGAGSSLPARAEVEQLLSIAY